MVYMMTKKSTRSTATFANVYTMLDRDELRANGIPVKDETPFVERTIGERVDNAMSIASAQRKIDAILLERLQALNAAAMKRATSGDRRRYYEAS